MIKTLLVAFQNNEFFRLGIKCQLEKTRVEDYVIRSLVGLSYSLAI